MELLINWINKKTERAVVGCREGTGRVRRCKVIINHNQTVQRQRKG